MRILTIVTLSLLAVPGCTSTEGDDDTGPDPAFVDGDGFPELTGTPTSEATIAKGETLHAQVPVDADTAYVRLAVEDYATSIVLVQNWADEGGPSTTVAADVEIPIGSSAAPGTYYFTVELCSTGGGCTNPFKRVSYERLAGGTTYQRTDFDSPPLAQVGEPRDSTIAIQTFDLVE